MDDIQYRTESALPNQPGYIGLPLAPNDVPPDFYVWIYYDYTFKSASKAYDYACSQCFPLGLRFLIRYNNFRSYNASGQPGGYIILISTE